MINKPMNAAISILTDLRRENLAKDLRQQHEKMLEALKHCHHWLQGHEAGRAAYIGEVIEAVGDITV